MFPLILPEKHCTKLLTYFFTSCCQIWKTDSVILPNGVALLFFNFKIDVLLFSLKSEKYKEKSKDLSAPEMLYVLIEQTLYSNK